MATVYDLLNADSSEVEEQRVIRSPGATTGDVLTVQANGTINPAPGGGPSVLYAKTSFTSANILASDVTPLVLVPAQGANTIVVPSLIVAYYHFVSAAYVIPGGFAVFVGDAGTNWSANFNDLNNILTAAVDTVGSIDFGYETLDNDGPTVATDLVNKPLQLAAGAAPTDGDGTLRVFATYGVFNVT